MTASNALGNDQSPQGSRPLRLVAAAGDPAAPTPSASLACPPASPALRRLQRELTASMAEARSLRELLEELPAILERKFQQRLQALLLEQRQLERENALLQQQLFALLSGGPSGLSQPLALPEARSEAAPAPVEQANSACSTAAAPSITDGLGLRRALRRLHR